MALEGKIVVITGGSMGIGEAAGRVFHGQGATVVLTSRDPGRAEDACRRLGGGDRLAAMALDVRDPAQVRATVDAVVARFGRIDVWINNAGHGLNDSIAAMDMAACRAMFETNLFGALECLQAVAPVMRRQRAGAIINISSVAGHIAVPYMGAYCATKFALNAVTRTARMELAGDGVNVINVCPGYVTTNFAENTVKGRERLRIGGSVRRGIAAERVARSILRAYLGNKREVVVPWRDRVAIKLYQLAPWLIEAVMRRALRPAAEAPSEPQPDTTP
jgi:short-subunit dehydrogenase